MTDPADQVSETEGSGMASHVNQFLLENANLHSNFHNTVNVCQDSYASVCQSVAK